MSLSLRFWGTRGSIASPGPSTVRFGGNTPCVELRTGEGWLVILDSGTGMRELGRSLLSRAEGQPIRGDIFLTHAHWDHIQGFPFFAPIFARGNHFRIWGASSLERSIDRVVRDQMSPVVFPVTFEELNARIDFQLMAPGVHDAKGYRVSATQVRHPGGCLGYRFWAAEGTSSVAYVPDNELGVGGAYDVGDDWRARFVEWLQGTTVLVHDATYTDEEYERFHQGWGHSTYKQSVELAIEARVKTLVLFHHKPERTDDELDVRLADCREMVKARGSSLNVVAAAEGMTFSI